MGCPLDVLCSTTLSDVVRSSLLGQALGSDICKWLVDVVSSFALMTPPSLAPSPSAMGGSLTLVLQHT
jgi:hypothetical protein